MDKAKLIEIIYAALPYSNQITGVSLDEEDAVRFTWRGHDLRIDLSLNCCEVGESLDCYSDLALLTGTLLKRVRAEKGAA
jgi:hypothetical protein